MEQPDFAWVHLTYRRMLDTTGGDHAAAATLTLAVVISSQGPHLAELTRQLTRLGDLTEEVAAEFRMPNLDHDPLETADYDGELD